MLFFKFDLYTYIHYISLIHLETFDCTKKRVIKYVYCFIYIQLYNDFLLEGCLTGAFDRMTKTSKDSESNKKTIDTNGKGKEPNGGVNKADSTGYVGNYKGERANENL